MTAWTLVPGYPREIGGTLLWFGSRAKFVRGVREEKGGKTTTISGLAAFVQRFEQAMIDAHRRGADGALPALEATLDDLSGAGYAGNPPRFRDHVEQIAYVRYRGTEVDLALTAAKLRGKARIHLDLAGPLGKFADQPPPPDEPRPEKKKAAPRAPAKPAPAKGPTPENLARARELLEADARTAHQGQVARGETDVPWSAALVESAMLWETLPTFEPIAEYPNLRFLTQVNGKLPAAALLGSKVAGLSIGAKAKIVNPAALADVAITSLDLEAPDPEVPFDKLPLTHLRLGKLDDPSLLARVPASIVLLGIRSAKALLDLAPIARLGGLVELTVKGAGVRDLSPLRGLTKLRRVSFESSKALATLAGLDDAAALEVMDANLTGVADVRALAGKRALREVRLRGAPLADARPLFTCEALEVLYLEKTQIASLAGIERLSRLTLLWVWDTRITDASPIGALTSLVELHLAGMTRIQKFDFLRKLRSLERLDLQNTTFTDVAWLASLSKLQKVRLAGCPVKPDAPEVMRLDAILRGRGGLVSFDPSSGWERRS